MKHFSTNMLILDKIHFYLLLIIESGVTVSSQISSLHLKLSSVLFFGYGGPVEGVSHAVAVFHCFY